MNITFLIGNGFDLGMGLSTRFSDFFPLYLATAFDKDNAILDFAKEINCNITEWSYFERQLGRYLEKFDQNNKHDFLSQLKDFEIEFINFLTKQELLLDYGENNLISSTMLKALRAFYDRENLREYGKEKIEDIFTKYKNTSHKYNFISFNYTKILEQCLNCIKDGEIYKRYVSSPALIDSVGEIVHVHGTIDSGPIMGVNDKSQINNSLLAEDKEFQKFIIKPQINRAHKMNNDIKTERLIKSSKIICIYGMSLGETDKYWWNSLIDWLNENEEHQLVIYDYDSEYVNNTHIAWIEKEDYIISKLISYYDKNVDIEEIRDRIHIAVNKPIFQIDLMKKHNEEFEIAFNMLQEMQQ